MFHKVTINWPAVLPSKWCHHRAPSKGVAGEQVMLCVGNVVGYRRVSLNVLSNFGCAISDWYRHVLSLLMYVYHSLPVLSHMPITPHPSLFLSFHNVSIWTFPLNVLPPLCPFFLPRKIATRRRMKTQCCVLSLFWKPHHVLVCVWACVCICGTIVAGLYLWCCANPMKAACVIALLLFTFFLFVFKCACVCTLFIVYRWHKKHWLRNETNLWLHSLTNVQEIL